MQLTPAHGILYAVESQTKKTLFSFFDTAYRFYADCGEPPAFAPAFKDDPEPRPPRARSEGEGAGLSGQPGHPGAFGRESRHAPPPHRERHAGEGADDPHGFSSLEEISAAVAACAACALAAGRKRPVPGEGAENAFALIVGEGPGAEEDLRGRPFVGKSGQLLDKMLAAISLSRDSNVYIANIVKCRPPGNRDPLPQEAFECARFLKAQIGIIRPKAILAVGRVAAQNLLETKEGVTKLRGRFLEYRGIPLMVTYHPSALLRDERLKRPAWEDLKLFREKLRELEPGYERKFAEGAALN